MRIIEPKDLTDKLNEGIHTDELISFSGEVIFQGFKKGCSVRMNHSRMQLQLLSKHENLKKYRLSTDDQNERKSNFEFIFYTDTLSSARLTHPSEGANRIAVVGKDHLIYLQNLQNITY
ncbi:MAG: hypothetical protein WCK29_00900 [archaeon]